ncbi:hypothetical protein DPMN_190521 [Dreissena polymorpha]|uniref:Uncharacterized protein n=1 Tax=Dreissena polymorpha TaxID=45954 RepID=A0A9D4DU08_DREPO|nr:hypothetical protein DPMN_190521 [Dreissena polymorpha]
MLVKKFTAFPTTSNTTPKPPPIAALGRMLSPRKVVSSSTDISRPAPSDSV